VEDKKNELNSIIYKGLLPLAFLNSSVIKLEESVRENNIVKVKTNKKYSQINLPDASTSILISKIYEIH
jgi:hypothetical protein